MKVANASAQITLVSEVLPTKRDTSRVPPLVSIVVPVFNGMPHLAALTESLLAQTYPDLEIIFSEGGGTDGSMAYLTGIQDPRVRLVSQTKGTSAAQNWTAVTHEARGEFIALLDADDLWAPEYLATHLARMRADPALGVSFNACRFMTADGAPTRERSRPQLSGFTPADILSTNPCTTCSAIVVRAEVFREVGSFNESLRRAEDQEWLFRVALSKWRIEGIDDLLVDYRISPNGLSANLEGMYEGFRAMLAAARDSAPDLVREAGPLAAARMLRYLARRALRLDLDRGIARGFITRALATAPRMVLSEPRQTIATLLAATIPGVNTLLFKVLQRA